MLRKWVNKFGRFRLKVGCTHFNQVVFRCNTSSTLRTKDNFAGCIGCFYKVAKYDTQQIVLIKKHHFKYLIFHSVGDNQISFMHVLYSRHLWMFNLHLHDRSTLHCNLNFTNNCNLIHLIIYISFCVSCHKRML